MEAMGGNGWQQQKQRMCIDQVQNQRTTKEENSCTMHMHFTCASLVVHIKLERSSLLSICPRSAVVCAPLLHIALLSLRSLSRILGVMSFFGFFSLQWSIFHFFQTKKRSLNDQQTHVLLHHCANVIWSLKQPEGFHLSVLVIFFD
jgi:hypothetical protein